MKKIELTDEEYLIICQMIRQVNINSNMAEMFVKLQEKFKIIKKLEEINMEEVNN